MTRDAFFNGLDGQTLAGMAATAITIVGVIFSALALSNLTWSVLAGPGHAVELPSSGSAAPGASVRADYSILERMTPFQGTAPAMPETIEQKMDSSQAPETDLDLVLHGIIASGEDAGRVVISSGEGLQKRYSIGDTVDGANGATVNRVYADSVLLDRDGSIERLPYSGDGTLGALQRLDDPSSNTTVQSPTTRVSAAPPANEPSTEAPASAASAVRASARLSRNDFLTLAQSLRFDPDTGLETGGVSVFPTRNAELFQQAGLRPGDVVQSAGGIAVAGQADFTRLMAQVDTEKTIDLSLVRNGEQRLLTINIDD